MFSWAAPTAYGGSQARGLIGAVATGLRQSHSNAGSELRLPHTPQLRARPWIEPATSWFLVGFVNHCAMTGTLSYPSFKFCLAVSLGQIVELNVGTSPLDLLSP